jgi:2-polyprenyl-6-methoxyphenol hydroxylase-like FAD-dependent oxidoreductase
MRDRQQDHAVVLGGSIAGLLAARVLAGAYDQITVVDRDELAPGSKPRRGVPQARHIHGLLPRGQQVLEQLFPGLTAELVAHGAPTGDLLADARLLFGGHRLARTESGLVLLSVSRPLLEDRIRARVRALPQVRFTPPSDAVGLRCTHEGRRITGVRLLRRADASAEEVIEADLVVDATGRGSRAPAWLQGLGFGQPDVDRVRVDVGYVTRLYRLPPDCLDGDLGCVHGHAPDWPRGGALARLEGDIWMLTLFGLLGDHPPKDPDGFDAFARSLPFPDINKAVGAAEPLEGPAGYRFPANVRRRYERMRRFPEGFLVIGDALCSFNPIYGQGMTVAALQALALRDHLRPGMTPASRPVLRALARVIDAPWELTIGADLTVPGVDGRRTPKLRVANAYVTRLQAAAAHDPALARAFIRVTALVDPPTALLRPRIVSQVLGARARPDRPAGGPANRSSDSPSPRLPGAAPASKTKTSS